MAWAPDEETNQLIWHLALQNAFEYEGKGAVGSVIGRIMSTRADLRQFGGQISPIVAQSVQKANVLAQEKGLEHIETILMTEAPQLLEGRQKQEKREGLPDLKNIDGVKPVFRFAPNPNGPLSFGHARGIVINGTYSKEHEGTLILRFDDTDTTVKPPELSAYDLIPEEVEWLLGRPADRIVVASNRIPEYYQHTEQMLGEGFGYVCKCSAEAFREFRESKSNCPCRDKSVDENISDWNKMLDGTYKPGDAVVRVKTDMTLKNPALRDWPALRMQDTEKNPHPRPNIGSKYKVWPLLDFQSAVEDHLQGVTHIIRGKDLMDSTRKQTLLYDHFGWTYPETIYWGRVKVHEWGGFSTSKMRASIENGEYSGWNDPRLPTIQGLKSRGIQAEALRNFWIELGVTQKDISVPLATLFAHNTKKIDDDAPRLSFIRNPVEISLTGNIPENVELPVHPNHEDKGVRVVNLNPPSIFIESDDAKESYRLKEFADIDANGHIESIERSDKRPIIHWTSVSTSKDATLMIPHQEEIQHISGRIESNDYPIGTIVQLERIGYAIICENGYLLMHE
ncbi:MAG: glutamate--tRNA ligase [Candidatus Thermoplasmatota archaeon]|nr:glutamate--tRNA ligase [Candidatus Thermoplasmatota archaeon]